LSPTAALANATAYTFSCFVKNGTRGFVQLLFPSDGFDLNAFANFDLSLGVVGTVGSSTTASITNVGNGWYRCTVTATSSGAVNTSPNIIFVTSSTAPRAGSITGTGKTLFVWGAQLEVGAFASSYIPTTSSQVTRAADVAVMTGTNFSSWYNQSQGTFFAESSASGTNYFATSYMVGQAAADSMRCIRWDDGTDRVLDVRAGNVLQASATTSGASASATKYAGAYAASNFGSARSGTLTMSTTTGTVPLVDRLFLGSTAGAFHLFGHIRRIAYWNTRLTNAELQSLTS